MKHIKTQSGKIIIACGAEGSPVRTRDKYDITYQKVYNRILNDSSNEGYLRHSDRKDLEIICEDDNVTDHFEKQDIIRSAYFYFNSRPKTSVL